MRNFIKKLTPRSIIKNRKSIIVTTAIFIFGWFTGVASVPIEPADLESPEVVTETVEVEKVVYRTPEACRSLVARDDVYYLRTVNYFGALADASRDGESELLEIVLLENQVQIDAYDESLVPRRALINKCLQE